MSIQFTLDEVQDKKLDEWLKQHNQECKYYHTQGASGGRLQFIFIPTNIGLITKVRCECGNEIDLTDYDMW